MKMFCCRQNFASTLIDSLSLLRTTHPHLLDVTLMTADGQKIRAHKAVLAAGCGYFNSMFSEAGVKCDLVLLREFEGRLMRMFVDFLYKGRIEVDSGDMTEFVKIAAFLNVDDLKWGIREGQERRARMENDDPVALNVDDDEMEDKTGDIEHIVVDENENEKDEEEQEQEDEIRNDESFVSAIFENSNEEKEKYIKRPNLSLSRNDRNNETPIKKTSSLTGVKKEPISLPKTHNNNNNNAIKRTKLSPSDFNTSDESQGEDDIPADTNDQIIRCSICRRVFTSRRLFQSHIRTHNIKGERNVVEKYGFKVKG